jgi:uncharacterized protein (TIGR03437 family)
MAKNAFFGCLSLLLAVSAAMAAPTLRLIVPDIRGANPALALRQANGAVLPVWIASGTNGPSNLSFEAWNSGDGALNLAVNSGTAEWLLPSIQGTQPCSTNTSVTCTIVRVQFDTAALPNGTYEGEVVVEDENAVDAPQSVPIKVYVGGNVPDAVDFYLPPDTAVKQWVEFETPEPAVQNQATTLTAPASGALTVSTSGSGSFQFLYTHRITATYQQGMAMGDTTATATVAGSSFGGDNRSFPVNVHVTNDPIAQPSAQTLQIVTAQEVEAPVLGLVISNRGNGTLVAGEVEVETDSGGDWLSVAESEAASPAGPAQSAGSTTYLVTASQEGLEPGLYSGTIRVASNAANGPTEVKVLFAVEPQQPPELTFRGVVNGATFSPNQPLARGTLVSLFGNQFTYALSQATETPLPTELGSTQVMVGGTPAPLVFTSWGQINFQVPNEVPLGTTTVQVVRDGQAGNTITATIANRSPGLFLLNPVLLGQYGAITNASQGGNFPIPRELAAELGINGAPARPGDILTIYATGLGDVAPVVPSGHAAPGQEPFAEIVEKPRVNFLAKFLFPLREDPSFVGLTPGFVGLFQINVAVPDQAPANPRTPVNVEGLTGGLSNTVEIAVE